MTAMESARALAELGPAAVWLIWAVIGLLAVLVGYIGLALVAALKANTPEAQRYRSGLLRELLRFIRDLLRGWGER